jgi:hypothetical protein
VRFQRIKRAPRDWREIKKARLWRKKLRDGPYFAFHIFAHSFQLWTWNLSAESKNRRAVESLPV